jgi:glycolate oxidase
MGLLEELRAAFGPRALLSRPEKEVYRYDAILVGEAPLAVVLPGSTAEVQALVRLARRYGVPLVPRGAGSGLSGGAVPLEGAIVVAFTRMARLEVDPKTRTAWAEPGVTTAQVSEAARSFGLFYPPDPASLRTSTLGGTWGKTPGGPFALSTGSRGITSWSWSGWTGRGRCGAWAGRPTTSRASSSARRGLWASSPGSGSAFFPLPQHRATLMAVFPEVEALAEGVSRAIALGAVPAKLEFMDQSAVNAVEDYLGMGLPRNRALLLVETDGDDKELVEEELSLVERTALRAWGRGA